MRLSPTAVWTNPLLEALAERHERAPAMPPPACDGGAPSAPLWPEEWGPCPGAAPRCAPEGRDGGGPLGRHRAPPALTPPGLAEPDRSLSYRADQVRAGAAARRSTGDVIATVRQIRSPQRREAFLEELAATAKFSGPGVVLDLAERALAEGAAYGAVQLYARIAREIGWAEDSARYHAGFGAAARAAGLLTRAVVEFQASVERAPAAADLRFQLAATAELASRDLARNPRATLGAATHAELARKNYRRALDLARGRRERAPFQAALEAFEAAPTIAALAASTFSRTMLEDRSAVPDLLAGVAAVAAPEDREALDRLAHEAWDAGEVDRAAQLLRQAQRLGPPRPALEQELATLEFERGDDARALEHLTRALDLDPPARVMWRIHNGIAVIFWEAAKRARAAGDPVDFEFWRSRALDRFDYVLERRPHADGVARNREVVRRARFGPSSSAGQPESVD